MKKLLSLVLATFLLLQMQAQNPVISSVFTADPAAMVYNDTVFLYTGHDESTDNTGYVMNDWYCFTTNDMETWESHGPVLDVADVSWAKGDAWAGEVEERNGKFYFYFTAEHNTVNGKAIGVAVSDSPYGPFVPETKAIITNNLTTNISSTWDDIDPTVYIDEEGQAYMYWGNSQCYYVKLKENMVDTLGSIVEIDLDSYTEAPYLHKAKDTYYLSYAYGWPEEIAYATSSSLEGPWTFQGVVNRSVNNCGTNHQSIIDFKGQHYFIYHTGDIGGDYQRAVAVEYLFYTDEDSTQVEEVVQTSYGVQNVSQTASCPPLALAPYASTNDDSPVLSCDVTVIEEDSLKLQPQAGEKGSWSWDGPTDPISTDSVLTIKNITKDIDGIYTAIFTSSCGTKSYVNYYVDVNFKTPDNITSGETYTITSVSTDKVISVKNDGTTNGSDVILADNENKSSQQFLITLVSDPNWSILPSNNTAESLDVYGISTDDGANINLWEYWGGDGQLWQFGELEEGVYCILSKNSDKCLQVMSDNNLEQWTCDEGDDQKFTLAVAVPNSITPNTVKSQLQIAPNPSTSGYFNVEVSDDIIQEVTCYTSAGQLIFAAKDIQSSQYSMQESLESGVYFVLVRTDKETFTKKVIVSNE